MDEKYFRPKAKPVEEGLPLFANQSDAEQDNRIARAASLFRELLHKARHDGLATHWARPAFQRAGLITGGEVQRQLSWLGHVPHKAGAVDSGRTVWINGNKQPIWLHPDFAPAARSA